MICSIDSLNIFPIGNVWFRDKVYNREIERKSREDNCDNNYLCILYIYMLF